MPYKIYHLPKKGDHYRVREIKNNKIIAYDTTREKAEAQKHKK